MAEQDEPDLLGGGVGGILEGIGGKLPEANFDLDCSDEDSEIDEGGISVFSRSRHLEGLGIEEDTAPDVDTETEGGNFKAPVITEQDTLPIKGAESTQLEQSITAADVTLKSSTRGKSTSDDSGVEDTDWTKFKTEFSENLQTSENKINSGQPPEDRVTSPPSSNLRQQLLIDAITSLHSSGQGQPKKGEQHGDENNDQTSFQFSAQSENNERTTRAHAFSGDGVRVRGNRDSESISDHQHQQAVVTQSSHVEGSTTDAAKNTSDSTKVADKRDGMMSPHTCGSSQKSLLSLEAFDSIHEASLDHALMSIDATRSNSARTSGESDSGLDMSGNNKEPSSRSPPPPPPPGEPKLAWGAPQADGGDHNVNESLMKELEQLSLAQRSNKVTGSAASKLKASGHSKGLPGTSQPPSVSDKPTVFLDLRPSSDAALSSAGQGSSAKLEATREESYNSESEESDDPYSWITQRKQIKGDMESKTLSSLTDNQNKTVSSATSTQQTKGGDRRGKPLSFNETRRNGQPQHNLYQSRRSPNTGSPITSPRKQNIQKVGVVKPHPQGPVNKPQVVNEVISTGGTAQTGKTARGAEINKQKGSAKESKSSPDIAQNHIATEPKGGQVLRQRSSDSFTLSSSPSEGETPNYSSEGTSHSEDQSLRTQKGSSFKDGGSSKPSLSSGKGKKSSKKQSKKSKKKGKGQGGQSSSSSAAEQQARSKRISKRRAYVLERIRSDSLTSSDEEHSLGSSEMSTSSSSTDSGTSLLFLHQDSILEDGDSAVVDIDKLKCHLQRRIMAKKPPATFETPATQPIFHEDISFERELVCTKPGMSPEALLVVQICEHGLIAPPEIFSEIDASAKLGFHLLILTWLLRASLSAELAQMPNRNGKSNAAQEANGVEDFDSKDGTLPFEIVALQYTILDGNPSILVGIKVSTDAKDEALHRVCSGGPDTFHESEESEFEVYLHQTPLSAVLGGIASDDTVQTLLSPATLDQLKPVLNSPLDSVFTFQDDVTPLSTPVSFFWYTGYHPSCLPAPTSLKSQSPLMTTVCSLGTVSGSNEGLVFSILSGLYRKGLDLAGVRLMYGAPCSSIEASLAMEDCEGESDNVFDESAMLCLAIRGPDAIYNLMDIIGPRDESLAKITDPNSVTARYGNSSTCDLHCLRTPYSASAALGKYFGGRACLKSASILGISDAYTRHERKKRQRVRFSESESAAEDLPPSPLIDVPFPPLVTNRQRLIAEPYTKVIMVVSPHVPVSCYSTVLTSCDRQGFDLFGVKRLRLNSKRANTLNISPSFMIHFTPSSTPPSPIASEFLTHPLFSEHAQAAPPLPSCLLILGRENALLHTLALKAALVSDLASLLTNNPAISESSNLLSLVEYADSLFHITEFSGELVKFLGNFSISNAVSSTQPKLGGSWDMQDPYQDELCFAAVPQSDGLAKATQLLDNLFCVSPVHNHDHRYGTATNQNSTSTILTASRASTTDTDSEGLGHFELLGFKVVPELPRFHAKQLCPLSNGDSQYQQAINLLSDVPATLLLLRGIGANRRLRVNLTSLNDQNSSSINRVSSNLKQKLQVIISSDFQDAYRLASIFFTDKELFSDLPSWTLSAYVPLSWHSDSGILNRMQHEQEGFCTVVTISMSQVRTALKVMDKLSRSGCGFVGVACRAGEREDVEEVIPLDTEATISDPIIVLCVQRVNAVWHVQHILKSFIDNQMLKSQLYCSGGFSSSIADIKQYFPTGLFCQPSTMITEYQIKQETQDNFDSLKAPASSLSSLSSSGGLQTTISSYLSPLSETNVMILPPSLVRKEHNHAQLSTADFVKVLDFLVVSAGFCLHGLKMVRLSLLTAGALHAICCSDTSSETKVEELHSGPSLIVTVQRDNAISCCQMIIKSALQSTRGSHGDYLNILMAKVIYPTDAKKAKQVMDLFQQS